MGRRWSMLFLALLATVVLPAAAAQADPVGLEHLHYAAGPYEVTPGANLILLQYSHVPKPTQDGYITRMAPNLRYALPNGKCCGTVPRVDVIHLHHGVWLSNGQAGAGVGPGYEGGFYPFMASGEEKTLTELPPGYGYPVGKNDYWVINYMIHNLTSTPTKVYITYNLDFLPATAPAAADMTPVHPIWNDVERGQIYPVFNVLRHSGTHGTYTFPDMAKNPYGSGQPLNELTITHPGTLIGTAGHVHPGGLYTDLDLIRSGANPAPGITPGAEPNSVRLFRSTAHYWDKRGPISWDMAMGATRFDWRPAVKAGDVLRVSATYDTTRAAWYESMGIMVVWEAYDDPTGTDPFTHQVDLTGVLTHGHLPENNNHGGDYAIGRAMSSFPACTRHVVSIAGFTYLPGDLTAHGPERCIPTIHQGQSLKFINEDASPRSVFSYTNLFNPSPFYLQSIFHTITACQNPCGLNTGISYPLANGPGDYDSGELGIGTPGNGSLSWSTPRGLKPGTYTFYCRIHPFMRGVFRIIG